MKRYLTAFLALVFLGLFSNAQTPAYNVVFDLTSNDSISQQSVIRWINEISKSNPSARMEVVMYGQGIDLVTKEKSTMASTVQQLAANKNIQFAVCEAALKNHHLDKTSLLPRVTTVPDGIYEIITKQSQGWGYIKVAH